MEQGKQQNPLKDVQQPLLPRDASPHHATQLPGPGGMPPAVGLGSSHSGESLEEALARADATSRKASRRQMVGLLLYAISTLFGTGMSLMAKLCGQRGIGVFEVVLIRSLFLVAFTAPELVWRQLNPFGDRIRRWLYLLRGVLGYFSVSSLYLAVTLLPMGDAAVLSFLSPLFVAAFSPCVLRERPSKGLLLAIPFCMAGVVLVAKPSFIFGHGAAGAISGLGVTVGIMQAVFNAAARMAVRALSLGSSEPIAAILFSMGLVSSICAGGTLAVLRTFVVPRGLWTYLILLANGLFGYLYQVTLTAGLQRADAAPAVAMSYLGVIWGIVADIIIFGTPPTALSLAGAAVISASSFLVAYGERRRQQKAKAALRWEASQERLLAAGSSASSRTSSATDLVLLLPSHPASEDSGRLTPSGTGGTGAAGGGLVAAGGQSAGAADVVVVGEEGEGISTPTGREPLVTLRVAGDEHGLEGAGMDWCGFGGPADGVGPHAVTVVEEGVPMSWQGEMGEEEAEEAEEGGVMRP